LFPEAAVFPLSQLVPELLLALGGAFLLGNLAAYVRLRPAWREAKRARQSHADRASDRTGAEAPGTKTVAAKAGDAKSTAARAATLPSRTRVLANVIAGLAVTVASLAALVSRG
jgi:hypothetical protein